MPNRTSNIHLLPQRVTERSQPGSASFTRSNPTESGATDRTALNRQIQKILDGLSEKPSLAPRVEQDFDAVRETLRKGDVPATAKHVCALISLEMDELRKAALLS